MGLLRAPLRQWSGGGLNASCRVLLYMTKMLSRKKRKKEKDSQNSTKCEKMFLLEIL